MNQQDRPFDDVVGELMQLSKEPIGKCFVYGRMVHARESILFFEVTRGDLAIEVPFVKSVIAVGRDSADTALIEIPVVYCDLFGLQEFVLDDAEVEKRRRHVEMFNAPMLRPTSTKKPEKIGNIRI